MRMLMKWKGGSGFLKLMLRYYMIAPFSETRQESLADVLVSVFGKSRLCDWVV